MKKSAILPVVLAVTAVTGCRQPSSEVAPLVISRLESPAANSSGQPRLTVSPHGVILSWIDGVDAALKFAEHTAQGWSYSRTVAQGERLVINWADVPSVVRLPDNTLVAHWLEGSAPGSDAYDVRVASSHDDGRTWSTPAPPHHDGTETPHGFASIFQMPAGGFGIVWLDGRDMKEGPGDEFEGDMTLRARTYDAKGAAGEEVVLNKRTCECCQTAAAVTADGPIVAFRNRSADEVRDIYTTRLTGGKWTDPALLHQDRWQISGCPINGPAISARDRQVAVAWFTGQGGNGRSFIAFSKDAGQTFGAPIRVEDSASLGRMDIQLLPDGSAAVTWIEFANQHGQFDVRRIDAEGRRSAATTIAGVGTDRTSGFPRMALHDDQLLFAWTEGSESMRVITASASIR